MYLQLLAKPIEHMASRILKPFKTTKANKYLTDRLYKSVLHCNSHFLRGRHCTKFFTYIISVDLYQNPERQAVFHVTDEETGSSGLVICFCSLSYLVLEPEF